MVCCSSSNHFVVYLFVFVFCLVRSHGRWQVKVKGKPSNDRPPYFDFSVLRLKSLRMILLSSGIGAIGAYTPLFYLVISFLNSFFFFFLSFSFSHIIPPHRRMTQTATGNTHTFLFYRRELATFFFFGTPNSRLVFSSGLPGCPGMPVTCSDKIKAAKFARRPSVGDRLRGTTTIYINRGPGTNWWLPFTSAQKGEAFFLFFYRRARTNETNERRKRLRDVPVKGGGVGGAAAAVLDDVSFNENPTPGPAPKIEAEISTQLVWEKKKKKKECVSNA